MSNLEIARSAWFEVPPVHRSYQRYTVNERAFVFQVNFSSPLSKVGLVSFKSKLVDYFVLFIQMSVCTKGREKQLMLLKKIFFSRQTLAPIK